ncbi:putative transcriptional regulator [Sporolactobacillus inulinus]|uniref:Putative transcriptional regulator n=1 Tax=Sporolactobacillus inulinus TaxID=2078 RepID=A0A4Y1ZFN1_9BACL|nr:putative transcriptional regulator [Sporolactobacillus inulinus]
MILSFIEEYGSASRQDINDLLMDKVSDALSEKQKLSKINNLIYEMSRKDNTISNTGSKRKSRWEKLK